MTDLTNFKKTFKNKDLLDQALTHKSWVNEHPNVRGTNERLEFLGDAVLEFVVSEYLFKEFPEKEEGFLTALRANLVNTVNLSEVAKELGIGSHIYLSKGEEDTGGRTNTSLLADTVEAVIGSIFMDRGLAPAQEFIHENILVKLPDMIKKPLKDAKSMLQEVVQSKSLPTPKYVVAGESGPDHAKIFVIEVIIDGKPMAKGEGKSKAEAEQDAASAALKKFL